MSVTAIYYTTPPRLGKSSAGKEITLRLHAVCDDKMDGILTVEAHGDCPAIGEGYAYGSESDATIVCTDVKIDPRVDNSGYEGSKVFDITATYSNAVPSGGLGEDEEDPLDDPPEYEFRFNKYQVPALVDVDGNPVVTGADESFDPPYMIDENRPVVIITRNEASFNPAFAVEYQDAVNEDSWAGLDPGQAKMNLYARTATRGSISYFIVTYEIECRWQGWNPTGILAQGFKYRKAASGQVENYIDPATGEPPSSPILLALDGTKSPDPLGDGALPYFHEFTFYREKNFSALNLGL